MRLAMAEMKPITLSSSSTIQACVDVGEGPDGQATIGQVDRWSASQCQGLPTGRGWKVCSAPALAALLKVTQGITPERQAQGNDQFPPLVAQIRENLVFLGQQGSGHALELLAA